MEERLETHTPATADRSGRAIGERKPDERCTVNEVHTTHRTQAIGGAGDLMAFYHRRRRPINALHGHDLSDRDTVGGGICATEPLPRLIYAVCHQYLVARRGSIDPLASHNGQKPGLILRIPEGIESSTTDRL